MTATPAATLTVDPDVAALVDSVLGDYARGISGTSVRAANTAELWRRLGMLGLARLTGTEASGGSGAGWAEAAALLSTAARHGLPLPYVEHDLLAGWLLEQAGLPCDDRQRTACVLDATGTARGVGWASAADAVVVLWHAGERYYVADVPGERCHREANHNVAGEPRDLVRVRTADLAGTEVGTHVPDLFRLRGALARGIQISAAMEAVVELSLTHATTRAQFGRPLARFQAVQHLVADCAAEATLARAATDTALTHCLRHGWGDQRLAGRIAIARSVSAAAAETVVRNAHQVHGAIGTTAEHPLHRFTLPVVAWRAEFGSPRYWDAEVTKAAVRAGGAGLWQLMLGTAGTASADATGCPSLDQERSG